MLPSMTPLLESRPLKRNKLGPADIYPQDPRQKEDEMTSANVKIGFINQPEISNESASAKDYMFDLAKVEKSFKSILSQKVINNTFPNTGRKKAPLSKDNFWLVPVAKNTKAHLMWIKDLGNGKSLSQLGKRVPIFNKKEEVIQILSENGIPIVRATWYIKMTASYHTIQAEAKVKKKVATFDPNPEWTQAIIKFKRELLLRLLEEYNGTGNANTSNEKNLKYISNLATHLYIEGMLDRQDFLTGIVELCEKLRTSDCIGMSYMLPMLMQYIHEIVKSQFLSRRLGFVVCRHLQVLLVDANDSPRSASPAVNNNSETSVGNVLSPKQTNLNESTIDVQPPLPPHFPEHLESIAFGLVGIIQVITVKCPSANVWYPPEDPKLSSIGSPIDTLPCAPSSLPLPIVPDDDKETLTERRELRELLKEREQEIIRRSYAVEMHWSSDKCQESVTGHIINRTLSALEALDKQKFCTSPLDVLYNKIFIYPYGKDAADSPASHIGEEAVIGLLCEWAISAKRLGEHRAALVAKLLDRRQMHLEHDRLRETSTLNKSLQEAGGNSDGSFNTSNNNNFPAGGSAHQPPLFQSLLFTFLDTQAPTLDCPSNKEELQSFRNLVQLFSELIQHDVFSYTQYINNLISRGDIVPGQINPTPIYSSLGGAANNRRLLDRNVTFGGPMSSKTSHDMMMLKDTEEEPPGGIRSLPDKNMSSGIFSPDYLLSPDQRSDRHFTDAMRSGSSENIKKDSSMKVIGEMWGYKQPRHQQYLMHFCIPFDDKSSGHESNQRLMLLYGAGRQRSEVKKEVKKVLKYLTKIVHNWTAFKDMDDIGPQSVGSKKKKKAMIAHFPTTMLLKRFRALSYFDKCYITHHAAKTILNSFSNYISDRNNTLPNIGAITLVMDIIEESLDYNGLLQLAVQLTSKLPSVEEAIMRKHPVHSQCYTKEVSLNMVAVLQHYQNYLTLNEELTLQAFDVLFRVVMNTTFKGPANCTTSEKRILMFLYGLHNLRVAKFPESYAALVMSIKQTLMQSNKPATSNLRYDPNFLEDEIRNPMAELPIVVAMLHADRLREPTGTCRYSFVCSTIISICTGHQTPASLNALATLCAEMNAKYNDLSSEWLGVLKALCCSSVNFNDVLMSVDASDASIRDPLSLFTAILIARNCLSLEDFIQHVAIPSLLAAVNKPRTNMADAQTGARLTCHLLLQLFKTPEHPSNMTASDRFTFQLQEASDRHSLAATQRSIAAGAVLAVLKAVLKLGDAGLKGGRMSGQSETENSVTSFLAPIGGMDDFEDDNHLALQTINNRNTSSLSSMDTVSLSEFAKHAVKIICSQQWVRERCFKDPPIYLLMDPVLVDEQRQNLIQLICCPEENLNPVADWVRNRHTYIYRLLKNMTRWTLRQTWLEISIMMKQADEDHDEILLADIAKAVIKVFQNQPSVGNSERNGSIMGVDLDRNNMWLVAPLISKLTTHVQACVLKEASQILESSQSGSHGKLDRDKAHTSLLNQQPFLTLILTCLKNQDKQRDSLLDSLQAQILQIHTEWQSAHQQMHRDTKDSATMSQAMVQEGLQLRLSLMGGMFDTIKSNTQSTSTVVVLLTQLIFTGVVDVKVNTDLFWTVFDMIAVLLHDTLRPGDSRREYITIVKKMKKEIGDRKSESLTILRRLLMLPRKENYVIVCEPTSATDRSLKVATKQKIIPWEIIEGLKTPAPLCLSWFGAARSERKELTYEKQHQLMLYHNHSKLTVEPESFWKPPELAPEEIEDDPPAPAKRKRDSNVSISSYSPSPSVTDGNKRKRQRGRRTKTKVNDTPSMYNHQEQLTPTLGVPNNVSFMTPGGYQSQYPVNPNPLPPYNYQSQHQPSMGGIPSMGYPSQQAGVYSGETSDVKARLQTKLRTRTQPSQTLIPQAQLTHNVIGGGMQDSPRHALRESIIDRRMADRRFNGGMVVRGPSQGMIPQGGVSMHHGNTNQPGYNFSGQAQHRMSSNAIMPNQGGYNSYNANHQQFQRSNAGMGQPQQQSYMGQGSMMKSNPVGQNYSGMVMQQNNSGYNMQQTNRQNNMMAITKQPQQSNQYGMMQQQMQSRPINRMNPQQGMGGNQGNMMSMHGGSMGGGQVGGMNALGQRQMMRPMPQMNQQQYGHVTQQQQNPAFVQNMRRGNMPYNQQQQQQQLHY